MKKDKTAATPGLRRGADISDVLTARKLDPAWSQAQVLAVQEALLLWYAKHRRDLPWRRTRDPYAIWVSEVMLQQTRVDTVIPYYERFLASFPTAMKLAEAPLQDVLAAWSGLGYYRRARFLHQGARFLSSRSYSLPEEREGLLDVPGVGKYTAGAIASIAFGEPVGLVDGNVARVLARVFAIDEDMRKRGLRVVEALADDIVWRADPGAWNQALMELGATVCVPRSPACEMCPLVSLCEAKRVGRVKDLPVLSAKAAAKVQRVQSLVAVRPSDGAVLLARRVLGGLFGGLWEAPSVDGPAAARRHLACWIPTRTPKRVGVVEHALSHRALTVDVVRAHLTQVPEKANIPAASGYDDVSVFSVTEMECMPMSTLARKVLRLAGLV